MLLANNLILHVACFVASLSLTNSQSCGLRNLTAVTSRQARSRTGRIMGGQQAELGEFPFSASVLFNGLYTCGGTIVSQIWVLTAAHCVTNYPALHFGVKVGSNYFIGLVPGGQIYGVQKIIIHPHFRAQLRFLNDIALLLLERRMTYTPYVLPACLPQTGFSYTGFDGTAVGLGFQSEGSSFPMMQRKVNLTVISNKECTEWYKLAGHGDVSPVGSQLCAGYEDGGKDACFGDSGGPLLVTCKDGRVRVIGVISAGIGCGRPRLPGLYTRVSSYTSWIKHVTRQKTNIVN